MEKCSKVKNPCKICLQTVTKKNGVQCKGACKKWAHYTCLNYTPGKIQDIKAGIITIMCPCPNCNIAADKKEILKDAPFTCNIQECPANKKPKCEEPECPVNKPLIAPVLSETYSATTNPPCIIDNDLASRAVSPKSSCNPSCTGLKPVKEKGSKKKLKKDVKPKSKAKQNECEVPDLPCSAVDCKTMPSEPPPCKPDTKDACFVTDVAPKSASCSCLSAVSILRIDTTNASTEISTQGKNLKGGDFKASCSDSKLRSSQNKEADKALLCTIHELCSTVGQLTNQIKNLMCKMMTDKP